MRDLKLEWDGKSYFIPEARAFELAERVEPIVTIAEIEELSRRPSLTKLARAYSAMLEVGGVTVPPEDVWRHLTAEAKAGSVRQANFIMTVLRALVEILLDGAPEPKAGDAGNGNRAARRKAKASSGSATPLPSGV